MRRLGGLHSPNSWRSLNAKTSTKFTTGQPPLMSELLSSEHMTELASFGEFYVASFYGRRCEKTMLQAAPLKRSIHCEKSNQETR